MKNYLFLFLLIIVTQLSNAQSTQVSNEIRIGAEGQFYFKNRYFSKGYWTQNGGNGRAATIGGGIPVNYVHHFQKFSVSLSPAIRYSLLEDPSLADPNYRNYKRKWGLTVDTHISIQWRLKGKAWIIKNTSLGLGLSVYNLGRSFDTYYNWSPNSNFNPSYEYQASTLMYYGIHALVEKRLGERFYLKFMVMYSKGEWIKYYPLFKYSVMGNISLQYRVFGK